MLLNSRLIMLAERRAALVAKTANQRAELASACEPWRGALQVADRGLLALRWLGRHRLFTLGAVALVVAIRPKVAFRWLRSGTVRKALVMWRTAMIVKHALER